ncbi:MULTISPECIES: SagB/ThcOx family dehydrogenase [Methanobacterium]|jgi:SagB-type dehydrogenase family enzyme|uniref:Dehydrogenase n=1 Tax=Methanobacterium subterraneum TaxID=59277 RepID=A0A2H4VRD1_9EURY|nr:MULTISPECIES: SagB/ThcOx family dehydrogenase [Methanobacterium]AUB57542.1 dehydrogenase [Methanobacterium sp. MZ-A1]AUB60663.1 dehydrogenase [Methanobacterium subterraneum]MBW4256088.1 SagB/ThcOx family dehydrogenase [Methanobacterium sp. YSL]NMO08319.1 SagB/ThcOx family dehydrogenase [Methanobacterium subterraneum]
MQKKSKYVLVAIILLSAFLAVYLAYTVFMQPVKTEIQSREILGTFNLPQAMISSNMSVDQAIQNRRSVRTFSTTALTLQDVSQLLWASQGITDSERNYRAAPSAGHVFPMEIYLVTGNNSVKELEAGIYHYNPFNNTLEKIVDGDQRYNLSQAAHQQKWVEAAPISLVITGNYQKMREKYPDERISTRFVDIEAGHIGENIYLEAVAHGMGTVAIGSFYDDQMINLLKLPSNETPIYIYPVGYPTS